MSCSAPFFTGRVHAIPYNQLPLISPNLLLLSRSTVFNNGCENSIQIIGENVISRYFLATQFGKWFQWEQKKMRKNIQVFRVLSLIIFLSALLLSCVSIKQDNSTDSSTFLKRWTDFKTSLIRQEKSFQPFREFDEKQGDFVAVTYLSDTFVLKGLLNTKNVDHKQKKPVIVYLHGGFALNYNEMKKTSAFTEKGFIVFAPSYRGENGNPGFTEFFLGEVRDAKAAIDWIAKQDYADENNIYVFGWSVGGGISLNLSLHDDTPIQLGASSAGIYDYGLMKSWATDDDMILFPYDYTNAEENYFRLPLYILPQMVRPHHTYIGSDDGFGFVKKLMDNLYPNKDTLLTLTELKGGHVSTRDIAIDRFIVDIEQHQKILTNK
ncbi:MAG: acetyl esterase/lipase [Oceanicoccus sp.]|jgi:acetyl esterase/lipase